MTKEETINKINSFKNFGYNWNGYGAEPISEVVIEKAIKLVEELTPTPEAFPTAADSIQLEWETEGVYVELEVTKNEIKLYYEKTND